MTRLRSGSATDVGRVRSSNQDVLLEDPDLFAVADGMGGHVGGEVAAHVAVDALRSSFRRQRTVEGLRRAVAEANRAVWHQGQTDTGLRGMGTTLTATALVDDESGREVIALANVGDSRAYVYSNGEVIQVTADHSLAEERVRQGDMTEAEAAVHPHRHILTRALGVSSDVDVDLWELQLSTGDRILWCSDGLTNEVDDERICHLLETIPDPGAAARALVKAAVDHGGSDNVTVVVVDVVEGSTDGRSRAAEVIPGAEPSASAEPSEPSDASSAGPGSALPSGARGGAVAAATAVGEPATGDLTAVVQTVAPARERGSNGRGSSGDTALHRRPASYARFTDLEPRDGSGDEVVDVEEGTRPVPVRTQRAPRRDRRTRARERRSAGVPRLVTIRVVVFFVLLLAVVAAAYGLVRWYATNDWYVTVDHGYLAVYQGRPGGFLWFKPKLVDKTTVPTSQILSFHLPTVRADKQEPSLSAARTYIADLHQEYLAQQSLASGATATEPTAGASGSSPATTTAATTTAATHSALGHSIRGALAS